MRAGSFPSFTQLISWFYNRYAIFSILSNLRPLLLPDPLTYQPGQLWNTESLYCLPCGPVFRALWICLTSDSYYRNSNSLDLDEVWQYLSYSYNVFCHFKLCNLKPFSLNLGTRKKKLFLLLANSDSEVLMSAIRQENKILSASTGKRFFFCDEYDFISRKCKRL